MRVSARDLRVRAAGILRAVRNGEHVTITYRGKEIGVLSPTSDPAEREFEPIGFGLWRGDARTRGVRRWIDRIRAPRHRR